MTKFAKGSPEAKAYMAYIRSKRGKKTKGGAIHKKNRKYSTGALRPEDMLYMYNLPESLHGKGLLSLPFKPIKWAAKLGAKGVKQLIKMIKKKKEESGGGDIQLPYNVGHLSSPGMYDDYSDFSRLFGFGRESSRYNEPIKKFLAETAYLEK